MWDTKKNGKILDATTREKVIFINVYKNEYSLKSLCNALEISPRTYYRNKDKEDSDDEDVTLIYKVFNNSMKTYGYRRVAQALKEDYGVIMNKKKVARLMHKYHIIPRYASNRRPNNTKKRIECNVKANLLKRQFNVDAPDKVWVTDVTYLRVKGKTWYLSTIMDLYDRSIVSFKIHFCNNLELVLQTLGWARLVRYNAKDVIIHSDQGFQYTSYEYQNMCRRYSFQISMSRKGTPLDNAVIESFHGRLKTETIHNNDIHSVEELKSMVIDWIDFYDRQRIKNPRKKKNKKLI